ncbi:MAG TPA: hypothetical protein VE664_04255 [Actinomycetes bacterium]|nr:hypothetical protein [Actinomycetes bacterium]
MDNSARCPRPRLDKATPPRGCSPGARKAEPSWRCVVRVLASIVVLLVIAALLAYTLRRRT